MANAKAITEVLRKSVRNLGIFSLIIAALEQLLDDQFICPCEKVYNAVTCVLYALVPSFACFAFAWFVEDGRMKENSTCCRFLDSILAALVWLCIFFFDGRYLACGLSYWRSVYAEGNVQGSALTLRWCKPTGPVNEVLYAETQEKTLKWMARSQIVSLALMLVIVVILALSRCCKLRCCHRRCHGSCHGWCHGWCDYCRESCPERGCGNRDVTKKTRNTEGEQEACV